MRQRTIRRKQQRSGRGSAPLPKSESSGNHLWLLSFLLFLGTLALFSPVRGHNFVSYDDDYYIVRNSHIRAGLSLETVRWSLTATEQCNWHPLTWLSHALDCQLFGLDAGSHHLVSAFIHSLNALLLFLLLRRATGGLKRSFLVAALFACHPLAVDSVAWAAERKNVLSMLFFLLTLGAYGRYALQPALKSFAVVLGMFILALASKPAAVTLPFVLLLIDYWPLARVAGWSEPSPVLAVPQRTVWPLIREKVPLFVLSAASCVLTLWAQKVGDAIRPSQLFPLSVRFSNALFSYGLYIWKMLWPLELAVFYPHPGATLAHWKTFVASLALCGISIAVWRQRKSQPYLIVGWLWFLGTLVPMIGVVQVGDQGLADRYAYLPLVGLFVLLVWGATEWFDFRHVGIKPRWAIAVTILALLSVLTLRQLTYWQDSVTLWSHAFEVTHGDLEVEKQLANAMVRENQTGLVAPHLIHIERLDPSDVSTHVNLGSSYRSEGKLQEAVGEFQTAIRLTGQRDLTVEDRRYRSVALLNLGTTYVSLKDYPDALLSFQNLNRLEPATVDQMIETFQNSVATAPSEREYENLALLLEAKGKLGEASSLLQGIIEENPGLSETRALLAYLDKSSK
jgi:protein O-mannosyl-transferase